MLPFSIRTLLKWRSHGSERCWYWLNVLIFRPGPVLRLRVRHDYKGAVGRVAVEFTNVSGMPIVNINVRVESLPALKVERFERCSYG